MVKPFHAPDFKRICDKCVGNADGCSVSELAFLQPDSSQLTFFHRLNAHTPNDVSVHNIANGGSRKNKWGLF